MSIQADFAENIRKTGVCPPMTGRQPPTPAVTSSGVAAASGLPTSVSVGDAISSATAVAQAIAMRHSMSMSNISTATTTSHHEPPYRVASSSYDTSATVTQPLKKKSRWE
jgi:hypothetical protein